MQETQEMVHSLSWEDALKKAMPTRYSILAWEIPWTEEPDGLPSMGSQRVGRDWATNTHTQTHTHFFITFTLLIRSKVWHCSAKYKDPNVRHCSSRGQWIGCGGHELIKFMIGTVHLMNLTWSCHVMPDTWPSIQPLWIPTDPVISPFTEKDIGAQVHTTLRFFFFNVDHF